MVIGPITTVSLCSLTVTRPFTTGESVRLLVRLGALLEKLYLSARIVTTTAGIAASAGNDVQMCDGLVGQMSDPRLFRPHCGDSQFRNSRIGNRVDEIVGIRRRNRRCLCAGSQSTTMGIRSMRELSAWRSPCNPAGPNLAETIEQLQEAIDQDKSAAPATKQPKPDNISKRLKSKEPVL